MEEEREGRRKRSRWCSALNSILKWKLSLDFTSLLVSLTEEKGVIIGVSDNFLFYFIFFEHEENLKNKIN